MKKPLLWVVPALVLFAAPYDEPHRPQFHFTPARNFMNDPNGLVYYKGEYHLFYQHNPFGNEWGHMSWGHAVSRDLVNWQHLPVALPEENGIMIFSGSAVVDAANTSGLCKGTEQDPSCLIAIYTGHQPTLQTQNIAFSNDRGRTWTKYSGNPVIDLGKKDFRDPKVIWHQASRQWILVAALPTERKVRFFRSPNLREWTAMTDFGPAGAPEGIWECPDLFPLPVEGASGQNRWVLVVSINPGSPAGGSGTQYFVGTFDGKEFRNENLPSTVLWADYGKDFYAPQSWFGAPDNRRIWIGWHSNWQYANKEPVSPWRGAQSVPRQLSLRRFPEGIRMLQQPVEELHALRGKLFRADHVSLEEASRRLAASGFSGEAFEMRAELELGTTQDVGFRLRTGNKEETVLDLRANPLILTLDRTRSGQVSFDQRFSGIQKVPLRVTNPIVLHVLVDRSSIEVFVNDGETVITDRIYPSPTSTGFSIYSSNPGAWIRKLEIWPLKPANFQ